MVKFSKQFEGQLVPEWKEAYVDYWQLKKDLKKIHSFKAGNELCNGKNGKESTNSISSCKKKLSLLLRKLPFSPHERRKEHGVIQVHKKLASSASKNDMYETELLDQFADTDATKEFFACLDQQLNKVNQFYRNKEKEFLERGESLKNQIGILIKLKKALQQQRERTRFSKDPKDDDSSISSSISCEDDSVKDVESEGAEMEYQNEVEEAGNVVKVRREDQNRLRSLSGRVISCQGKNLKMNIPLTTPSRTISAITKLVWEDLMNQSKKYGANQGGSMSINKTNLCHAEKMIRKALVELHKGLGFLKTYRNLNMLAFVKILKKFDKVSEKQVLPTYLRVVESSYFSTSDKVVKLTDEIEELFVKHFADDNKRKAMKYLKPNQRKESHAVTFFIGLFTGCFIALFAGYVIMAHIAGMYTAHSDTIYMETVYPVLRWIFFLCMFSLLFLHLFLYGCNILMWRKTRINYSFIFEFAPTKELKSGDVFLICTTAMSIVVGVMFAHLTLIAKGHSSSQIRAIPGLLLLLFLVLLVCPFNILYHSGRYHFLRVLRNIALSPLYKVVMLDFFMADQLCSQVPMLRSLEYVACYYITGSYKTEDYGFCMRTKHYRELAYAVSFLPYYWRAMQCARRWFDEGETSHLINLGKYVSAMLAAGAKVAYEKEKTAGWLALLVVVSSTATVYQLYWDFVKDWGLLQAGSKNPWLRNELILRQKFIYFFSMGLNLVLRLAWLQTVLHSNFGSIDYRVTGFFLAALEVIRRGQWNFYRLENEHLNNAGKFRAVKIVPLPFHEVDEED